MNAEEWISQKYPQKSSIVQSILDIFNFGFHLIPMLTRISNEKLSKGKRDIAKELKKSDNFISNIQGYYFKCIVPNHQTVTKQFPNK